MKHLCVEHDGLTLICEGVDDAACESAKDHGFAAAYEETTIARPIVLAGRSAWIKAGPARMRHTLRRRLLNLQAPRVRELRNLRWLHERLFRVPVPLAAGVVQQRGLLRYQFLITALLEDARPFEDVLAEDPPDARRPLIEELARETARMHALFFVHHDLHTRNLMVTPPTDTGDPRRLVFLDAWRGGPHYPWRGAAYDLGCLMLEGASLFTADEQRLLLELYLEERTAQGRPLQRAKFVRRTVRSRRARMRIVEREPNRWRLATPLAREWSW